MWQWLKRLFSSKTGNNWRGFKAVDQAKVDDSEEWKNRQI